MNNDANKLMSQEVNNKDFDIFDIREIFEILFSAKIKIILITSIVSIVTVVAALLIPNIYKSEVILAPTSASSNLTKLASQYSGLASMAGISLPTSGDVDKVDSGIQVLKSFNFFEDFANKNNLIYLLMAPNGWDRKSNEILINKKVYDTISDKWVSKIPYSINGKPSMQTVHRTFHKNSFIITKDKKTGFVSMSMEHYSPFIAKEILELIIIEINEITRNQDMLQAERSIQYLEEQILGTQLADVRTGLNELVQNQVETIMLAKATPEYLFKTLSPPIAPEKKSEPRRSIICIAGFFLGFIFSSIYVLINHYLRKSK